MEQGERQRSWNNAGLKFNSTSIASTQYSTSRRAALSPQNHTHWSPMQGHCKQQWHWQTMEFLIRGHEWTIIQLGELELKHMYETGLELDFSQTTVRVVRPLTTPLHCWSQCCFGKHKVTANMAENRKHTNIADGKFWTFSGWECRKGDKVDTKLTSWFCSEHCNALNAKWHTYRQRR